MKVLILGVDGYIGWPLALHLMGFGHEVYGVDAGLRREFVDSLTPLPSVGERMKVIERFWFFNIAVNYSLLADVFKTVKPDAIVHLAEQPSAPYSMRNREHCLYTHLNNVTGTLNVLHAMRDHCPHAHLVKLGTMGEYGTPECKIPEGEIPGECLTGHRIHGTRDSGAYHYCDMGGLPFPKSPGSFYHATKVHDSVNIQLACKIWNLRSTDVMQGIVFGVKTAEMEFHEDSLTRFDYDQYFGTVINRFCTQALIGAPITPYGKGGQTRGFLPLEDSVQCLRLGIENPPGAGQYRVFNQFKRVYSVNGLARIVQTAGEKWGSCSSIRHVENPRIELEAHQYDVESVALRKLGYDPQWKMSDKVEELIKDLLPFQDRVRENIITPTTHWSGEDRKVEYL